MRIESKELKYWNSIEQNNLVSKGKYLTQLLKDTKFKNIESEFGIKVSESSKNRYIYVYKCYLVDSTIYINTSMLGVLKHTTPTKTIAKIKEIQIALNQESISTKEIKLYITPNADVRTPKAIELDLIDEVVEAKEEIKIVSNNNQIITLELSEAYNEIRELKSRVAYQDRLLELAKQPTIEAKESISISSEDELKFFKELTSANKELKELRETIKTFKVENNVKRLKTIIVNLKKVRNKDKQIVQIEKLKVALKESKLREKILKQTSKFNNMFKLNEMVNTFINSEIFYRRRDLFGRNTDSKETLIYEKNFFKALELFNVTGNTTEDELKKQWKKLAREVHPDKEGGSETLMMELNTLFDMAKGMSLDKDLLKKNNSKTEYQAHINRVYENLDLKKKEIEELKIKI